MNDESSAEETIWRAKGIALVSHDNRKADLMEWVAWNYQTLQPHHLICTGTTGGLVANKLREKLGTAEDPQALPKMTLLKSGPLGGDQQLGALIAEERIDLVIFFWDPLEPQPHDVDVKALLRIAVVYNVPIACNRATADFIISSPLLGQPYRRHLPDLDAYVRRPLPI
jgi:methylglyoxal synthase